MAKDNTMIGSRNVALSLEDGGAYVWLLGVKNSDGTSSPIVSGGIPVFASGSVEKIGADITRSSNTTAYAALDVIAPTVAAVITFTNAARVAGLGGYVTGARVMTNRSTDTARLRLHLYEAAPTAIADNAPFTLLYANRAARIGSVTFPALATEAAGSDSVEAMNYDFRYGFKCAAAARDIYGILETLDAFTPASGQFFYVEIRVDQN